MTMTLLGTLMTMRLLEIYTTMSLMGYPTHCDIMWDTKDNDIDGGTLSTRGPLITMIL